MPLRIPRETPEKVVHEVIQRSKEEFSKGLELIPRKLRIRRVNEKDIARFPRAFMRPPRLSQYLVEWEYEHISEFEQEYNLIYRTWLALRLLKAGAVFLENLYSFRRGAKRLGLEKVIMPPPRRSFSAGYTLYLNEKEDLIEVFEKLRTVDFGHRNTFRIACDRFLRYYYEHHPEDRLIDLMIGFEALLEIGPQIRNKGKAIASQCSKLIGKDHYEEKRICETIQKAYKLRNKVVHGDEHWENKIAETVVVIEDYLRRSILDLCQRQ